MLISGERDRESRVLIRELNHRTCNEFQALLHLVSKCARQAQSEGSSRTLQDLERRIFAFASLNRLLARPEITMSAGELCRRCCELLLSAYGRSDVVLRLDILDLPLTDRELTYLSLVLTELIVNALKHSLASDRVDILSVALKADRNGAALHVCDNAGTGARSHPVIAPRTVHALAACFGGEVAITACPGYAVTVRFPIAREASLRDDRRQRFAQNSAWPCAHA